MKERLVLVMSEYIRYATMDDMDKLFEWRNEENVRKNSFNQEEVLYDEHYDWIKKVLNDPNQKIYIVCNNGVDIGMLRVSVIDNCAEIGYSIDVKQRGHGYGTKSLELVKEQVKKDFPFVTALIGRVKLDNEISKRAFEKAQYRAEYVQYICEI